MLKWFVGAAFLLSLFVLQACSPVKQNQPDCGFVQNVYGERISWKGQTPIKIYIHSSVPAKFYGAIQSAASTWEKRFGKKLFTIASDEIVDGPINPHQDGKNIIYLMDTWETDRASEQARTSIYWVGDQIKEADIRLSPNYKSAFYWNETPPDDGINFEALVLHEMGHVLGLKHRDTDNSVMATYLPVKTDRVNPANIDVTSLQCEY